MGQNMVSHKRNFKVLVEMMDKVANIFGRMQGLDKNIRLNMQTLHDIMIAANKTNQGNFEEMSKMVVENLTEVEETAKDDIRECLEPVGPFLCRKKMNAECESMLGDMLNSYLEYPPPVAQAQAQAIGTPK